MKSNDFSLQESAPDTLSVSGALNFDTAGRVLEQASARLASGAFETLDLRDVGAVDSAGLACVLALMAEARRRGSDLRVCNVPEGLNLLARVSDADTLLQGS